jgi:hypothetical protein
MTVEQSDQSLGTLIAATVMTVFYWLASVFD